MHVATLPIAADTGSPWLVYVILVAAFGAATIIALARWQSKREALACPLAQPSWSFSDSWASTLTVVGGLLGTVVASKAFPTTPTYLSNATLAGLSLIFAVFVLVAPIAYKAFQDRTETATSPTSPYDPKTAPATYRGTVALFILASWLTMIGVFGQLITVIFILRELEHGSLPHGAFLILAIAAAFAAVLAAIYAWVSIGWTADDAKFIQDHATRAVGGEVPARSWTLL